MQSGVMCSFGGTPTLMSSSGILATILCSRRSLHEVLRGSSPMLHTVWQKLKLRSESSAESENESKWERGLRTRFLSEHSHLLLRLSTMAALPQMHCSINSLQSGKALEKAANSTGGTWVRIWE